MSGKYIALTCPSCGAAVGENVKKCPSCGVGLLFELDTTGASLLQIKSLLALSMYSEAVVKCREFLSHGVVSADIYYYMCIALLEGKKPFVHTRDRIDECIETLDRALKLSDKGIIYLLRAYIEYDYFERKFLNRNPNYKYYIVKAKDSGISKEEKNSLEELINNQINIGERI